MVAASCELDQLQVLDAGWLRSGTPDFQEQDAQSSARPNHVVMQGTALRGAFDSARSRNCDWDAFIVSSHLLATYFHHQNIHSLLLPTPQTSALGLRSLVAGLPSLPLPIPCTGPTLYGTWPTYRDDALDSVSMASRSMRCTSSAHVGISWMRPMTCPAVHTCCSCELVAACAVVHLYRDPPAVLVFDFQPSAPPPPGSRNVTVTSHTIRVQP